MSGKTPGHAAYEAWQATRWPHDPAPPWDHPATKNAKAAWEAAAQAAIATLGIDPDQLDMLADWFDADDEFKTTMFPDTWPQRGNEVQSDLRRWAKQLRAGLEQP